MSLPALFVRLVAYRLSLLLTMVIFALCLYDLPKTPLDQVRFIDKYTHVLMYLAYGTVLWVETGLRDLPPHKRWSVCVAWPVAMGGLIEVLQSLCTLHRHGDLLDVAANSLGVVLAVFVGRVACRFLSQHRSLLHSLLH